LPEAFTQAQPKGTCDRETPKSRGPVSGGDSQVRAEQKQEPGVKTKHIPHSDMASSINFSSTLTEHLPRKRICYVVRACKAGRTHPCPHGAHRPTERLTAKYVITIHYDKSRKKPKTP